MVLTLVILGSQTVLGYGIKENEAQTDQTQTSFTFNWEPVVNDEYQTYADHYDLYVAEDYEMIDQVQPISVTVTASSYTVSGLKPGTEYNVEMNVGYIFLDGTSDTESSQQSIKWNNNTKKEGLRLQVFFTLYIIFS